MRAELNGEKCEACRPGAVPAQEPVPEAADNCCSVDGESPETDGGRWGLAVGVRTHRSAVAVAFAAAAGWR